MAKELQVGYNIQNCIVTYDYENQAVVDQNPNKFHILLDSKRLIGKNKYGPNEAVVFDLASLEK